MPASNTEPRPFAECPPFEQWDFEALSPDHSRSGEYNDHRLRARRKLGALGKALVKRAKPAAIALDSRSSLHNPHAFNKNQVRRLWVYVCRAKAEKTRLRKVLGRDLAKDLDSAYRNAYLCVALEHEALEVSLRIHADAWFDGQNLVHRTRAEGPRGWLQLLNQLDGYQLKLHDWKGEWRCGDLQPEALEEFLRFYTPGEHQLTVEKRWPVSTQPAAREAIMADDVPAMLLDEAERLLPLYNFTAWSEQSDFLFSK
jgi:hypothetical protein